MRIAAVTSSGACGIADYADQLIAELPRDLQVVRDPAWLEPERCLADLDRAPAQMVWLNHHAALHVRWTPEHVRKLQSNGVRVVATLHDTRAGDASARNSDQLLGLYEMCDATVVHEPVEDMPKAHYIRHGVPRPAGSWLFGAGHDRDPQGLCFKAWNEQPVLGTVGFDFPWKNLTRVVEVSATAGWAMMILSNNASAEREAEWRAINPALLCVREFLPQQAAIRYLASCDATIFAYECANNGTSGAIRQGLGARKPLIAWRSCRQWRDLLLAEGSEAIHWCQDFDHLPDVLRFISIQRIDPGIVYLAERDSWPKQAAKYLEIFRAVCA